MLADSGNVAYVSNEGGRPATKADFTNLSDGTPIVSSPNTGGATTGTVSVVNLTTGKETQEIPVGLQPTALYQHGSALFVANSNDDSMSVIDEGTNRSPRRSRPIRCPGARVGSYANAISMPDPNHVLVSIGRDNAIAVYSYAGLYRRDAFIGSAPDRLVPGGGRARPGARCPADRGHQRQGHRRARARVDDQQGPYTPSPRDRTQHLRRHRQRHLFTMPADSNPARHQDGLQRQRLEQIKPINQGAYDTVPPVIPAHLGGARRSSTSS